MTAAEVLLVVRGRDDASKVLGGISKNATAMGNSLKSAGKVAALGLAGGIGIAAVGIKAFVGEAEEARKIMSQTEAVLKSTGGAAGLNAKQIAAMAQEYSNATNFTDDAVQSAQNVLLTFTKVGKEAFKPATAAILDMSTALGTDLQSATILVGKALNDPIKGVTALTKSGVQFTKSQKDQIAALVANNDLLGAQKIILGELETQFGGSAAAAADPMTQLGNTIGELKEQLGTLLLPVVMTFARVLKDDIVPMIQTATGAIGNFATVIRAGLSGDITAAAEAFNLLPGPLQAIALWLADNRPTIENVARAIGEFAERVGELAKDALAGWVRIFQELAPHLATFGQYIADHKPLLIALGIALGAVVLVLIGIPALILAVIVVVGLLANHWDEIKAKTLEVWGTISDFMNERLSFLVLIATFYFESIKNVIQTAILVVRDIITIVTALIRGDWDAAWAGVRQLLNDVWDGMVTDVALKLALMRDVVAMIAVTIGNALKDGIIAGIKGIGGALGSLQSGLEAGMKAVLNAAIDTINDAIPNKIAIKFGPDINLPDNPIPHLARGGIVTRPTLALIGEAGPEAVIPLNQASSVRGPSTFYIQELHIHGNPDMDLAAAVVAAGG